MYVSVKSDYFASPPINCSLEVGRYIHGAVKTLGSKTCDVDLATGKFHRLDTVFYPTKIAIGLDTAPHARGSFVVLPDLPIYITGTAGLHVSKGKMEFASFRVSPSEDVTAQRSLVHTVQELHYAPGKFTEVPGFQETDEGRKRGNSLLPLRCMIFKPFGLHTASFSALPGGEGQNVKNWHVVAWKTTATATEVRTGITPDLSVRSGADTVSTSGELQKVPEQDAMIFARKWNCRTPSVSCDVEFETEGEGGLIFLADGRGWIEGTLESLSRKSTLQRVHVRGSSTMTEVLAVGLVPTSVNAGVLLRLSLVLHQNTISLRVNQRTILTAPLPYNLTSIVPSSQTAGAGMVVKRGKLLFSNPDFREST